MTSVVDAVEIAGKAYLKAESEGLDGFSLIFQDILGGTPGPKLEWDWRGTYEFRIQLADKFIQNIDDQWEGINDVETGDSLLQKVFMIYLAVKACCVAVDDLTARKIFSLERKCTCLIVDNYEVNKRPVDTGLEERVSKTNLKYAMACVACQCYLLAPDRVWQSFGCEIWRYLYENHIVRP